MTTNKHTDDFLKEEVFDYDSWMKWVIEYKEVKERERMLIHEAIETGLIKDVKHLISCEMVYVVEDTDDTLRRE